MIKVKNDPKNYARREVKAHHRAPVSTSKAEKGMKRFMEARMAKGMFLDFREVSGSIKKR